MESFNIIISARLKDNPVVRLLDELGTNIRYMSLRRGEFLLSDKIGIKYMTAETFDQSVKSRSIYREIVEVKREYIEPVLIIEGNIKGAAVSLDLTVWQAAEIFISVVNRIPIIRTANNVETAQLLFMLAAQIGAGFDIAASMASEEAAPAPAAVAIEDNGGDPMRRIVQSLPDVGPALAEALLAHFGSLAGLCAAGREELKRVTGVGPKRAKHIYDFLHRKQVQQKLN